MSKKGVGNAENRPRIAARLKSGIAEALGLPKEILLNLPVITATGNEQINIENYKAVVEYTGETVRINTACGMLSIGGKGLFIIRISTESVTIGGRIADVRYGG